MGESAIQTPQSAFRIPQLNWPSLDDLLALDWEQPPCPHNRDDENVLLLPAIKGTPQPSGQALPPTLPPVATGFDKAGAFPPLAVSRNVTAGVKHLLFNLGETVYALAVANIVGIHRPLPITPLPNLPAWFLGVTNLRGDILSVFDLGAFLGQEERPPAPRQRMVVVRAPQLGMETVIVVDQVRELHNFPPAQITAETAPSPQSFCSGSARHKGEPVHLLALEEVLRQSAHSH